MKNRGPILAALVLGAGLAACGGGAADEETAVEARTEKPAEKSASPEAGTEVDGEMYAAVNDDRRKWYVTHLEQDGGWKRGSFWRAMSMKNTYQVTLFGLPTKSTQPSGKGDVVMSLVIQGETNNARVVSAELSYFADGLSKTWRSDEGGSAQVMLNRFIVDGDYIDIGGGFSGVVELPDTGDAAAETDQPQKIEIKDGSFAVRIRQMQR